LDCATKKRLLEEYNKAVALQSESAQCLARRMGTLTREQYNLLLGLDTSSRETAKQALLALEQHRAEHGC
jgi:hypothetical protein